MLSKKDYPDLGDDQNRVIYGDDIAYQMKTEREQAAAQKAQQHKNKVTAGGFNMTPEMVPLQNAMNMGMAQGRQTFIDDPRMKQILGQFQDRAKGYDSNVLGGVRQEARGQIAGKQQAVQRGISSAAARGGVGGARLAALQGQAQLQGGQQVAGAERGMALENAQMQMKQGEALSDFMLRQQIGVAGAGAAYAQMASAQNTAKKS